MNSRWIISRVNLIRGDYPGTHIANADTSVTIANTWRAEVTNPEEASPVIELTRLEDAKDVTLSAGCLEYNSFLVFSTADRSYILTLKKRCG